MIFNRHKIFLSILAALPFVTSLSKPVFASDTSLLNNATNHEKINLSNQKATEHFVRMELQSLIPWIKKQENMGKILTSKQKMERANFLKKAIAKKMDELTALGFQPTDPVVLVDIGFSVVATKDQLAKIYEIDGIKSIIAKPYIRPQRNYSTPWIGGARAHDLGFKGKGQVIGILDTGIDYTHKDFGGDGNYLQNPPDAIEPGSFPIGRVIGGYDFVGNASDSFSAIPDENPMDYRGHGTHVAGIAAGNGIEGIVGPGIAPEASILAYKVFSDDRDVIDENRNKVVEAIEMAIDPNQDGDMSDSATVLNLSFGISFGGLNTPSTVAVKNVIDSGVSVVLAAANNGNNIPYNINDIGATVEDAILVAASAVGNMPRTFIPFSSESGRRFDIFASLFETQLIPAITTPIVGEVVKMTPFDACDPPSDSDINGRIVVTFDDFFSCPFFVKVDNLKRAGASALILVSDRIPLMADIIAPSDGNVEGIPVLDITSEEYKQLDQELDNYKVVAELSKDNVKAYTTAADVIASFSSRGPGPSGLFKPDVSAPGFNITSATARTGDGVDISNGTSMAAPQVAGMVALLKEKFPNLAPPAIKAIIQNTTTPAKLYNQPDLSPPLSLQGTGVVNIEKALQATSYVYPGGVGFGVINPEYNASATRYMTITNMSNYGKRYRIEHAPNQRLPDGVMQISVNSEVYVGAGQSERIPVNMHINANKLQGSRRNEVDGWLLVRSDEEMMRVGYMAIVNPASKLNVSKQNGIFQLRNDAFGDAIVHPYTLAFHRGNSSEPNSIKSMGFRLSDKGFLELGINANEDWANFGFKQFEMWIDLDEDNIDDYHITVQHEGAFRASRNDDLDVIIRSLTGAMPPAFVKTANAYLDNSIMTINLLDIIRFDGDNTFNYRASIKDLLDVSAQTQMTGSIDLSKSINFDQEVVSVAAQRSSSLQANGSTEILFLSPTEKKGSRSIIR